MERREFITLFGSTAVAWPLTARAQQSTKRATIGYISPNTASAQSPWTAVFVQRLRELGWIEGTTVAIKYRWADGNNNRLHEFAAELVRDKVDIILTASTPAAIAAKNATAVIPIVFAASGDPIGAGLVASLGRPGGNITGLSVQQTETASKRIELLRQLVPDLRRLAVLTNMSNPAVSLEVDEVQTAARKLNIEVVRLDVRRVEDIADAFATLDSRAADALYVSADPLLHSNDGPISAFALKAQLPSIYNFREEVVAGGLLSYGPNFPDLYRRAAELVDKILRGAKPADIPVEQPTKFDFTLNLTTAKKLGLNIPGSVLSLASELIE
jgi:putative ABC transport system substrate-binding protein